jgi:hypothetical protein
MARTVVVVEVADNYLSLGLPNVSGGTAQRVLVTAHRWVLSSDRAGRMRDHQCFSVYLNSAQANHR